MRNLCSIFLLFLLIAASALAAPPSSNIEGVFSQKALDAELVGLGAAGAAYLDTPASMLLNPAGLASCSRLNISFTQISLFDGLLPTTFASGVMPTKLGLVFGLGMVKTEPQFEKFSYYENEYVFSVGRQFGDFALGTNFRLLDVYSSRASTGAGEIKGQGNCLDFGVIWKRERLNTALVLRNVLGEVEGENYTRETLPLRVHLGFSLSIDPSLYFIVDIHDLNNKLDVKLGFEKFLTRDFALRVGYSGDSFSFGLGLAYSWLKIDYAYKISEIEQIGILTAGVRF